jgi:hypothetical protein
MFAFHSYFTQLILGLKTPIYSSCNGKTWHELSHRIDRPHLFGATTGRSFSRMLRL